MTRLREKLVTNDRKTHVSRITRKTAKATRLREIELRLMSELMQNSRRSDREIAKALAISQPAVSRIIKKLEKEGYIREYTMIPDFGKLGFQMLALIFFKLRHPLDSHEVDEMRRITSVELDEGCCGIIMLEGGMGLGYDGVIIGYFCNYVSYLKYRSMLKGCPFLDVYQTEDFLVSLDEEFHYRPLTISQTARELVKFCIRKLY